MRALLPPLFLLTLFLIVASCTTPNTRADCAVSRFCVLSGMLTAARAANVEMARMELPNGECVAVSLPDEMQHALVERGAHQATVTGRVFPDPGDDSGVTAIIVNDRPVGRGLCGGGFYLFVY